jgi:hypothetical protein
MQKEIEYEVHYDVVATIEYTGEENPGEYYFRIMRHWVDLVFDDEDDEAYATVNEKGEIEIESYEGGYIRDEEASAIGKMVEEILANPKVTSNE